jgi:hypothetical protein
MRRPQILTVELLQRSLYRTGLLRRTQKRRTGFGRESVSVNSVIERLEHRTLLAAVAAPTIHLSPDADTGRSNSDNIVNSLSAADFVISGGSISGLSSDIDVVTGPTLLEDGSSSPDFSEGRHAYTAQMIVKFSSDVAGASGGVADNITFPAHFIHSSDTLIITIDATAPDAPTVSLAPVLTGQLPDSFIAAVTNNSQTAFQGTAEADSIIRLFVNGELAGLTLTAPFDGNVAFAEGQWNLTPTLDLNDPAFFPVDGLREITVTAEDRAGNISEEGTVDALNHEFSPDPLGNDLFAQFGSNLGLPLVGNFDPPVAGSNGDDAIASSGTSASSSLQVARTVIASPAGIVESQGNDPNDPGTVTLNVFPLPNLAATSDNETGQVDSNIQLSDGESDYTDLSDAPDDEVTPPNGTDGDGLADETIDATETNQVVDESAGTNDSLTIGFDSLTDAL